VTAPEPQFAGLRILIVHEWLYTRAGAERCLEQLLEVVPHADLLAGIVTPEMRKSYEPARRAMESWVGRLPGARTHHRWFLPLHAAAFSRFDTSRYDLVISLSHAFEKTIRKRRGARHLCYCFSPPRWLYDLRDAHASRAPLHQRLALGAMLEPLRAIDRAGARGVDRFASISKTVADRVRRVYGRDSDVIYPPVSVKSASGAGPRGDFLLSLGRLVSYKRVDLAVAAAEQLGVRLVVAGDGPERARLRQMAGPHTEFVGRISEEEAGRLMSTCAAFVFCAEEDFGIAPLEANAHGAPVVGYSRGALTETMQDGVTGIMFQSQTAGAVAAAIRACLSIPWDTERLRANAARYSPERFRSEMLALLQDTMARPTTP
jgi:glycosyltransferase involved in cell wall biosynthesis